jgi:hypothetical protein
MMRTYLIALAFTLAGLVTFHSTVSRAAVVDIICRNSDCGLLPEELWSFDYDSQVLTLNETIYEIGPYSAGINGHTDRERTIQVRCIIDSDTTITVVKNVTNKTGVPWTSYAQWLSGADGTPEPFFTMVKDSVKSPRLPIITYPWVTTHSFMRFSGPQRILDGESFAIQFDVAVDWPGDHKLAGFDLEAGAIPEPATISLLALGALVLLRKQKTA